MYFKIRSVKKLVARNHLRKKHPMFKWFLGKFVCCVLYLAFPHLRYICRDSQFILAD